MIKIIQRNNLTQLFNISVLIVLCLVSAPPLYAASKCDSKQFTILKGNETIWSGTTQELFEKYPHGELGSGNRPERKTVRISKLIQDLNVNKNKNSQVTITACRNKSKKIAVADVISGDIDLWMVGIRTSEVRMFEVTKERKKPKQSYKRIISIQFSK